eukprot:SAG11_NODE_93_length_17080_cov_10.504093_12_plen_141_part_00
MPVERISGGTNLSRGSEPVETGPSIRSLRDKIIDDQRQKDAFTAQTKRAEQSIEKIKQRAQTRGNALSADEVSAIRDLEDSANKATASGTELATVLTKYKGMLSEKQTRLDNMKTWGADSVELDDLVIILYIVGLNSTSN